MVVVSSRAKRKGIGIIPHVDAGSDAVRRQDRLASCHDRMGILWHLSGISNSQKLREENKTDAAGGK